MFYLLDFSAGGGDSQRFAVMMSASPAGFTAREGPASVLCLPRRSSAACRWCCGRRTMARQPLVWAAAHMSPGLRDFGPLSVLLAGPCPSRLRVRRALPATLWHPPLFRRFVSGQRCPQTACPTASHHVSDPLSCPSPSSPGGPGDLSLVVAALEGAPRGWGNGGRLESN